MQEAVISAPVHVQAEQYWPSATFRDAHEAMQIPFAGWCEICVKARGTDMQHKKVQHHGLPLIVVETEMACDVIVLIVLAISRRTGYAFAVACAKGR